MEPDFPEIINNPRDHRLQILYTQINRDKINTPSFKTYSFGLKPEEYFYPASTTKLPLAVLALEKARLDENIDAFTPFKVDYELPRSFNENSGRKNAANPQSIANYLRSLFVVSDNPANNQLYEYVGRDYLNKRMWDLGYKETRIRHRLSVNPFLSHKEHTLPITFYRKNEPIYKIHEERSVLPLDVNFSNFMIGDYHVISGKKIDGPMDFSKKNFMNLKEQHQFLQQLIFPDYKKRGKVKLNLNSEDYAMLFKEMSLLPRQSKDPDYPDYNTYYDGYCKFFMYGDTKEKIPNNIKIYNKVGLAYGFVIDNAYIIDTENKVEFLLSAVTYNNPNNTMNDDNYAYDRITIPFLARLGREVYEYEKQRIKEVLPKFNDLLIKNDL